MTDYPAEYIFHKQLHIINGNNQEADNEEKITERQFAEVSFYPESGRYIFDQLVTMAFKANDKHGLGVEANGELYNSKGTLISSFETHHAGMGTIGFFAAKGESYYALVKNSKEKTIKTNLPKASNSGATINLKRRDGKVYINSPLSEGLPQNNLFPLMHNGSNLFYTDFLPKPVPIPCF
jgi:hypothetical protein